MKGNNMAQKTVGFGTCLREKRTAKGYSLRKFAELVGVSATYLSQVEQERVMTPTADRIKRMAEILDENADALTALAGRLPDDLTKIIIEHPTELPDLVREAGKFSDKQLRQVRKQIRRIQHQTP